MKIDLKDLEITDPKIIGKYMKQFSEFFIPASEYDTFDRELLDSDILHKSSEVIGQHQPIEVAICESDKEPIHSYFHIHLRIIDGRHRWKQSIKHNVVWFTKFYQISDYNQYMQLRGHFDSKKQTTTRERIEYFSNLAKYYEDVLQVTPNQICAKIVKDYSPPFNDATIRRYVPSQYKNEQARQAGSAGHKVMHKHSLKTIQEKAPHLIRQELANHRRQILELEDENLFLRSQIGTTTFRFPLYALEELDSNRWNCLHVLRDEKKAMDELNSLNTTKYRIRKVTQSYEIIYKDTDDPKILAQRKLAKYHHDEYLKMIDVY